MPRNRRSQKHNSGRHLVLDLHGYYYEDARKALIAFVEDFYNTGRECEIITGNSVKMQMMTKDVLEEYKIEYQEGDLLGNNSGYIKAWL